jgi:hypothetical protein
MGRIPNETLVRWGIGGGMGAVCLALGIWALRTGLRGGTAAGPLSHDDALFDILVGALITWGGFQSLVLVTVGERLPNLGHAVLLSVFLLLLGIPFLYFGIMTPEKIEGSFSILGAGIATSGDCNSRLGGWLFILVGSLCVAAPPFVWRHYIRNGLLSRPAGKDSGKQGC